MSARVALLAVLCLPSLALAQDATITTLDPESIRAQIFDYGHKARLSTGEEGDPVVEARSGAINYSVYFMNCENGANCLDLYFEASFDVEQPLTTEWANDWNKAWAFGRVWVNESGDPYLTHTVSAAGALPSVDFQGVLQQWDGILSGFVKDIGW